MQNSASLTRSYLIATGIVLGAVGGAKASFVSSSPDPFPVGSGFVQSPGCLTSGVLSGLCATDVKGLILSALSVAGGNQLFVLTEKVTGEITDHGASIGSFSVTGELGLTLFGRGRADETGTFDGQVDVEDYNGTFDYMGTPVPVEFTLDTSQKSTVQVTIQELLPQMQYQITSSFDIYSDISIDGLPAIPVGGFPVGGVATVPEPATWVLLAAPLLLLGFLRERQPA